MQIEYNNSESKYILGKGLEKFGNAFSLYIVTKLTCGKINNIMKGGSPSRHDALKIRWLEDNLIKQKFIKKNWRELT